MGGRGQLQAQGFILGWSLLLSLLLGSWAWMSSHGSGLALRSAVNQAEWQRVDALARLTLAQAQSRWPEQQARLWAQANGQWVRHRASFGVACVGGLCAAESPWAPAVLSGDADDPALQYQGELGQRVLRRPRYVWALLGQLPDGRLAYRLTVRAWGLDSRAVVTLNTLWLVTPPELIELIGG